MKAIFRWKEKRRKKKKKEIRSVMMSFMIELYKIKRIKKMKKHILRKNKRLNKQQSKIYGCSKTVLSVS